MDTLDNNKTFPLLMELKSEMEEWQARADVIRPNKDVGPKASYLTGQADGVAFGLSLAIDKIEKLLSKENVDMS